MKKKYINPSMTLVVVELQHMCNVSGRVDGNPGLTYDETPQDASAGMSRRHDSVWDYDEEEEEIERF